MILLTLGLALAADPDDMPFDATQPPATQEPAAPKESTETVDEATLRLRGSWRASRRGVVAGAVLMGAGAVTATALGIPCLDGYCINRIVAIPTGSLMFISGLFPLSIGSANMKRAEREAAELGVQLVVVPTLDKPGLTVVGRF